MPIANNINLETLSNGNISIDDRYGGHALGYITGGSTDANP
ncbi:hypothetical protein [Shewanella surugensis]|nr:hypothetical protein [Shewanella surugensis]